MVQLVSIMCRIHKIMRSMLALCLMRTFARQYLTLYTVYPTQVFELLNGWSQLDLSVLESTQMSVSVPVPVYNVKEQKSTVTPLLH